MKHHTQHRKICDSWYHQKWFRIVLVIVGVDMIMLGGMFILGMDIMTVLGTIHIIWRVIGGLAYILVALFIIHYALSYEHFRSRAYLVCQHCAHIAEAEKKD